MIRFQPIAFGLLASLWLVTGGCASLPSGMSLSLPAWASPTAASPGTASWWKSNRRKAELVPGQGFRVPGVPGFFDQNGNPMDAPIAEESLVFDEGKEKEEVGILPGLDPKTQYAKAKKIIGFGPNRERARIAYNKGLELYGEKRYAAAAKRFQEAADRASGTTIEAQSLYQLAECHFFDNKYIAARDAYVQLLDKHPNSGKVDSVVEKLWAIGQYWEKYESFSPDWPITPNLVDKKRPTFDTLGHAIKTYENIQLYDPTGPRADDAIMATAGIYFRMERFSDADQYYRLLRREYPRSDFQFEAHLLGLRTKLALYQGPNYDGTSLEGAKKLAKQLRTQFSGRLTSEERERLKQTQAEVARAIAERDMQMARHYENTEHYGSAKFYYAQVASKNADTSLAGEARERLAELSGLPEIPEERFSWLIDMFPENPERTRVARVPELRDARPGASKTRVAENVDPEN